MRTARIALIALLVGSWSLAQEPTPAPPPTLATWWADLEKDEPEATRAVLKLAARPKETTAFLKDKMAPLTVDAARIQFLLTMLGDEKDEVWKPAFEELEYFDPRLAIGLEELMTLAPAVPTRPTHGRRPQRERRPSSLARQDRQPPEDHAQDGEQVSQLPTPTITADRGGPRIKVERLTSGSGRGNPKKKWLRADPGDQRSSSRSARPRRPGSSGRWPPATPTPSRPGSPRRPWSGWAIKPG